MKNIFVFARLFVNTYIYSINLSQKIFILDIYKYVYVIFARFYLLFMIWQRLTAVMHIGYINDQIHYH